MTRTPPANAQGVGCGDGKNGYTPTRELGPTGNQAGARALASGAGEASGPGERVRGAPCIADLTHPATRTPSSIATFGSLLIVTFNSSPVDDAVTSKSPN